MTQGIERVIEPEEVYEESLSSRSGQWKNGDGQPNG